jgi:hypothetical protein
LESVAFDLLNDGSTPSFSATYLIFPVQGSLPSNQPHPTAGTGSLRFHTLTTDDDVEEAKKKAIPKNTDKNTSWAVNVWKQRSTHRCQVYASYSDWPTHLMITVPSELNYWLSKFVLEDRKADGEHYPLTLCKYFAAIHSRN